MKWLKRILISLLILIMLIAAGAYFWLRSSAPQYSGELHLKGLQQKTEVYFDEYGVPHIYASNKHDLYLAFGYIHAQDRLFQMEMLRRAGSGRLAEIIGRPVLKVDKMFRSLGLVEYAKESAAYLETQKGTPMYADITAYLEGINQFIEKGNTPPEFSIIGIEKTAFTTEDLYCITGAMSFSFSQAQKTEPVIDFIAKNYPKSYLKDMGLWHGKKETFMRSFPEMSPLELDFEIDEELDSASIPEFPSESFLHKNDQDAGLKMALLMNAIEDILPIAPLEGSNSWVVGGKKTASGEVLFCNDTHIGYMLPQTWYEAHLNAPDFELYGHFLSGVPFALVGRNRNLSWGLTMLLNDDMDFYSEKINPENPNEYFQHGVKKSFEIIDHTIKIKNEADTIIHVRYTNHGPVINDAFEGMNAENPISMFWTYTHVPNRTVNAFYGMNNSTKMSEFERNLPMIHAPGLNMNYGDNEGNIAWWACAKLLKRPTGTNSWTILGGDGQYDNPEYFDFSSNPKCVNPPWNYIYSANDWPDAMPEGESVLTYDTARMKISQSNKLIYYPGYYKPQYRADRIRLLLEEKNDWTLESMKAVMTDHINTADKELLESWKKTLDSYSSFQTNSEYDQYDELFEWDGNYDLISSSPTFFNKMLYHYLHETMADEIGEERFRLFLQTHQLQRTQVQLNAHEESAWWDNKNTNANEKKADIIFLAFTKSIAELRSQFGDNPKIWNWRKAAKLELKHPLGEVALFRPFFNVGPYPMNGGNETILQAGFKPDSTGEYKIFFGSQMRIMVDFANVDSALNVTPSGQSGHLMSKHYSDQAELYRNMQFRTQWMNRKKIETFEKLELLPE